MGGGSPDRVARGLPTGGQGSKVYVLCAEPKEHKHFRPGTRPGGSGTRPGGSVTGVTEKLFMFQIFMCLFRPLFSSLAIEVHAQDWCFLWMSISCRVKVCIGPSCSKTKEAVCLAANIVREEEEGHLHS